VNLQTLDDTALASLHIAPAEIRNAIEEAVREQVAGGLWTAPKAAVMPGDGRYAMATLSGSDSLGVAVVKSVMVCPENPSKGLAGINGGIMVLDSETGVLKAILGANWITAHRTAGLSAVMAARLANPQSKSIGFVGTGVQAHSHLEAFCDLFPIESIKISGRGQTNIDKLANHAEAIGLQTEICTSPQQAIEDVDLVVTSITLDYNVTPFLDARALKAGAFAAVTDLGIPWIDEGLHAASPLFVDDKAQEQVMEKPLVAPDLITGDLTSLLSTNSHSFDPTARAAFVFRGLALGDLAVVALALRRAKEIS